MDESAELRHIAEWRMAVWALRVGFGCLTVAVIGLIVLWSGSTPWVLAAGVIGWLICAVVLATGFVLARRRLTAPRPGFWPMRFMLIHDTVHARG